MQALVFSDELGAKPTIEEIPAEMREQAEVARAYMVERIAETDEDLTMKFLEGEEISRTELYAALRRAVVTNVLVPVMAGSSLRNKGVQPLLDAVVRYLPSPLDVPPVTGTDPDTGEVIERTADNSEPFSALVFKIVTDPFVGRLAYARVYSGKLSAGSAVYNVNRQRKERVGRLLQMYADKRDEIKECDAGDIAAIVGLKQTFTGETLADADQPILLETIEFPDPVIKVAVEPKSKGDQDKLTEALIKLAEEDPTFQVAYDDQTGQTVISGMGELHLDIIVDRLKREFRVQCNVGRPQVAYRETITRPVRIEGRFVRQSGGRGQYGHVWLEMAPNEPGEGFIFEDQHRGRRCAQGVYLGGAQGHRGGYGERRLGRLSGGGRQGGAGGRQLPRSGLERNGLQDRGQHGLQGRSAEGRRHAPGAGDEGGDRGPRGICRRRGGRLLQPPRRYRGHGVAQRRRTGHLGQCAAERDVRLCHGSALDDQRARHVYDGVLEVCAREPGRS